MVFEIVDKKEEEILMLDTVEQDFPKLRLNEYALSHLGDCLSQLIGFQIGR
jgi:hypothetical protein